MLQNSAEALASGRVEFGLQVTYPPSFPYTRGGGTPPLPLPGPPARKLVGEPEDLLLPLGALKTLQNTMFSYLEAILDHLGVNSGYLGGLLAHIAPSCFQSGGILAHHGPSWSHFEAILGPFWAFPGALDVQKPWFFLVVFNVFAIGPSSFQLRLSYPILCYLIVFLGPLGVILEPFWTLLGRSWGPLGPSWGYPGPS